MAGIYFHIPFCKTRCIYCDFFSSTSAETKEQYVDALCRELSLRRDYLKGESVETIYFGGGTPSQLEITDFQRVFSSLSSFPSSIPWEEITLEANPDDLSPEYIRSLRSLPFNRISIGIQSFRDEELCFLNRRHNARAAIQAVRNCQAAGFNNISIDLMYGLPGQTLEGWEENIRQAIALGVQHISAYHLIYEEGTPLFARLEREEISPVDEDLSVRMFETLIDMLTGGGFEHYEISNFARPGFQSRHNSSYWNGSYYLGLGASAHSYNGSGRHWNIASLPGYIASIKKEIIPMEWEEIDARTAYNDYILTRLRTRKGIDLNELASLFGEPKRSFCIRQAKKYLQGGLLLLEDSILRLSRKGIFVSDGIMSDLIDTDAE